jgi:hypothetical protein
MNVVKQQKSQEESAEALSCGSGIEAGSAPKALVSGKPFQMD